MKNNIQNIIDHFPKIFNFSIKNWLNNWKIKFLILLHLIKLRYPIKPIEIAAIDLLAFGLIYPLARIILGKKKGPIYYNSFVSFFCSSEILPLFKNKIIIPKNMSNYGPFFDIYIQNVYHQELLREGMNIIDIGAHIGVYTILAAEKVGESGKVIAIEPEPKNYGQLLENIKLNNFQNVISKNIALADHKGFGRLYLSSFLDGHSLTAQEDKNSYIEVPINTIDELLKELNLEKVDIIKIDAEGVEIPILKGAEKTLKANPNVKIIAASYHYPLEVKEVCQFLNDRGFKTKVSERDIVITI
jgi:FkbM family methyltransferase